MLDLTPDERRGALVLLALFALGTLWDLAHRRPRPAPSPVVAGDSSGIAQAGDVARETLAGSASPAGPGVPGAFRALDLNHASAEDLDRLPGIGPVLARRIVEQREREGAFRAVEDLRAVRGIGPKLYARLRPLVVVEGASPAPAMQAARRVAR